MTALRTIIFAGPSVPADRRQQTPGITWLPPAAAGDVAALLCDPPQCVCLIDGLFETRPAPWHKELMLLMAAGTRLFGAASMGALRAAELDGCGMIGIGSIYRAYRRGQLTGDDEVALIHATERLHWAPLTIPLVEVRATLLASVRRRLVSGTQARRLREAAGQVHFSERDWPALRSHWGARGLCDPATGAALERAYVPLKQFDALACIAAATGPLQEGPAPPAPPPPRTYYLAKLMEGRPR